MRWVEWPPADGFDVLGSLFNIGGPAWILFGLGVLAAFFIVGAAWSIAVVARNRGRAFQRQVQAEIDRRGGGAATNHVAPSTEWDSSTPTGWKVNTHDQ